MSTTELEKNFIALVQHSRDFIAMAGFDGTVLFVNEAGRDLVGLPRDADVSKIPLADFHTEEGMQRAPVLRATGRWEGEGYLRHFPSGALIPTQVSSFLVRSPDGESLCYATIQRDLRETRRLEEHLRQVQKMEAIGRLAGGVAHDFNNILSVILSYSVMLRAMLPPDSPLLEDVAEIHQAGARGAELTAQLLAFSRQQVLAPRVANLNEILVGMEKMLRRLLGDDVELRTSLTPALGMVRVDSGQMEQVILNLVVNARDAMPEGGSLTIATANVEASSNGATDGGATKSGAQVAMTFTDTGVGIDPATKSRIFDPFFTTKEAGKGTGLGLSIVFGILKQSGGNVTVDSEPGKRTTFTLSLPRFYGEASSLIPKMSASPAKGGGETILLVEGDTQVRHLMRGILERAGYRVLEAANPSDALLESARFEGEIQLLLTDLVMPKMSGRRLAEIIRAERPKTTALYVSGYTEDVVREHDVDSLPLLRKPVTPENLLIRIRETLDP